MSYYRNNNQLKDNGIMTGLMVIAGFVVGGSILHFLKPISDCPLPTETGETAKSVIPAIVESTDTRTRQTDVDNTLVEEENTPITNEIDTNSL